ncbi:Leucine-rich repeat 2 [Arabidopsis suecica]|uniref:Leucine-rich repeat 2 n=1 Tax=Arabidopsis suecica TaxID=45249 RepID=A0A8T1ZD74_ARASU|nr:Leucine-rich repeat 2 [Arabidopsis suecica]
MTVITYASKSAFKNLCLNFVLHNYHMRMGRESSKQARYPIRLILRLKRDRLSQLPDTLICHILSHLPIKETVTTSVLSTRWKNLWLKVPSLELIFSIFPNFNAFKSFGDSFFDSNRVSSINNLKLYFDEHDASYLTSWINAFVTRNIQRLYVRRVRGNYFHELPLSLYVCDTLVSLKLFHLTLVNPEFVSLPCLKIMHLNYVWFPNDATFERLVASCPVLEDLKIDVLWNDGRVYRVQSRSLKRLRLLRSSSMVFDSVPGVVIDAPLLCYLRISDHVSETYIVSNLKSNAKLDIHLDFGSEDCGETSVSSRRSHIRSFLPAISKVMDLTISENIFKVIHHYSNLAPLPQFDNMSRLHVTLRVSELKWLPNFLECCPNLKSLIVAFNGDFEKMGSEEMNQISFLLGMTRIVDMTIFMYTSKVIRHYSLLEPLPQFGYMFGYMSHMHVTLSMSLIKWLPIFLESCPKLKSLVLVFLGCEKINQLSFSSVNPKCLLSSLEFVELDAQIMGFDEELLNLAKYFLENSSILQKITVHRNIHGSTYEGLISKFRRRSRLCQVILI